MRTAIESLQAELLEARDVLARKAEERVEAFKSLHAAKAEVHRAHAGEQEAARVVEQYVNALDMLGVAADVEVGGR